MQMFKSRRSLPLLDQFSRYVVVGGIAFSADIGVLYILTEYFGWHYLVAATGSFLVGLGVKLSPVRNVDIPLPDTRKPAS